MVESRKIDEKFELEIVGLTVANQSCLKFDYNYF